ncbi:MAG TPA: hypothetical protein PKY78_09030 [Candidatus Omnitrophota bacterium]|nr:hypothetical protein [Candidatus Omnitrophota bacterium]HPS21113.1 hypothetical protein [Candidatus Omnitrophota bacterium]
MKNALKVFVLVAGIFLAYGTAAYAATDFNGKWLGEKPEWAPDVYVNSAFLTKYIWRGQNLGDEPVIQNDYSLSKWGLTLDLWTNYSLNTDKSKDAGRYQEYTEIDYTVSYFMNFGKTADMLKTTCPELLKPLNFTTGYTYYTFPNVDWSSRLFDTNEVFFGTSYDCLLKPSFTWYWDVDQGKGSYYKFGISHTFELPGGITANVGTTIAYNDEQWTTRSGWSDMNFTGSITIPFLGYFTVTPTVSYSLILDRDTYEDAQSDQFYGGLVVAFAY